MLCAAPALSDDPAPCAAEPCRVDGGSYFIDLPRGWDRRTPLPALLFFHGHNSSGASTLRSRSIRAAFRDRGYMIIAPNGDRFPGRDSRFWPARPNDRFRDDLAFIDRVLADLAARFPFDPSRTLVAGFSAGGSMAWMLGCYRGDRFGAFVSLAGALRRPLPDAERCPGGAFRMLHLHGFKDTQVPLEGRTIRDWHQGDVFESLALLRATNACPSKPSRITVADGYRCRSWDNCGSRKDIRLCLHDGGHGVPPGWAETARRWFEGGG